MKIANEPRNENELKSTSVPGPRPRLPREICARGRPSPRWTRWCRSRCRSGPPRMSLGSRRSRPAGRRRGGTFPRERPDVSLILDLRESEYVSVADQNGVHPPARNFGGTLGSGLLSLKFALRYAKVASTSASDTFSLCDSRSASHRAGGSLSDG